MALIQDKLSPKNSYNSFGRSFTNFNNDNFVNDLKEKLDTFMSNILIISKNNANDSF